MNKDYLLTDEEILQIWRGWLMTGCPDQDAAESLALKRLKGLLQAQLDKLSKWVDKPDSEGWWWFGGIIPNQQPNAEPQTRPLFVSDGAAYRTEYKYMGWELSAYVGKWCKAFVPEVK